MAMVISLDIANVESISDPSRNFAPDSASNLRGAKSLGECSRMQKYFVFGGVIYAGVATFITTGYYLQGSNSAYSSHVTLVDAMEVGLSWPWQLLQVAGIGA